MKQNHTADTQSPVLVFLDTETTGIENGRLIQLAYKKQGDKEKTVVEYFKPPVPIEIEAMAVHHITEKHVADKAAFGGSDAHHVLQALLADPHTILVAHNAKFDMGILEREGIAIDRDRFICTMKVAQSMYDLPQYKMQYLRYLWGIEDDEATAHDAEGDVAVLERVFDYLATDYAATHDGADAVEAFLEISKNPVLLRRAPFGKYAGKTFEEIKTADPGYLQWMATLADKDEDFLYTVNYYLQK
ncbi:MAG: exonuclease domain-containing protein [Candidatus Pacebacteria bacterium]|nr:exonuclease domain-containing protein [Candidatus Paceibacterota bacterium]